MKISDDGMLKALRQGLRALSIGGFLFMSTACKHAPPPPRLPFFAHLVVTAAPDANPDPTGRPSPVVIRLYRLRAGDTFGGAEMESLYFKDRDVLAADLILRDEWDLRPGETRDVQWELPTDVHVIGVMAALRDYVSVPWRVSLAVPPSPAKGPHVLTLSVEVSRAGLSIISSGLKDK